MNLLVSAGFVLVQSTGQISPVLAVLILSAVVIFVLWLVLRLMTNASSASRAKTYAAPEKAASVPAAAAAPAPAVPAASVRLDNLEVIEGIGPKIAGVLRAAGVTTFTQLAAMDSTKIADLLHAGGIRLADPRTWPEQARLAAAGDQAGLQDLQKNLRAGRTV